jgi:hypothetical protein
MMEIMVRISFDGFVFPIIHPGGAPCAGGTGIFGGGNPFSRASGAFRLSLPLWRAGRWRERAKRHRDLFSQRGASGFQAGGCHDRLTGGRFAENIEMDEKIMVKYKIVNLCKISCSLAGYELRGDPYD